MRRCWSLGAFLSLLPLLQCALPVASACGMPTWSTTDTAGAPLPAGRPCSHAVTIPDRYTTARYGFLFSATTMSFFLYVLILWSDKNFFHGS